MPTKISQMQAAQTLNGTEQFECVQTGNSRRTTLADIVAAVPAPPASGLLALMANQSFRTIIAHHAGLSIVGFDVPTEVSPGGAAAIIGPSAAGVIQSTPRRRVQSVSAINSSAGIRSASANDGVYRSLSEGSAGGFDMLMSFGIPSSAAATSRFFAGYKSTTAIIGDTTDPSALVQILGLAKDTADANFQFMHNDGSGAATKIDTGIPFAGLINRAIVLQISCPRQGQEISFALFNREIVGDPAAQQIAATTVSSNLPSNSVLLYWQLWANTGPSSASAAFVELARILELRPF